MTAIEADTLTHTYDCKTPNCTGTARSRVGRYSYCDDCQKRRAAASPGGATRPGATGSSFVEQFAAIQGQAKRVDKLRAKAKRATETALKAKREADAAEQQLRQAVRDLGAVD